MGNREIILVAEKIDGTDGRTQHRKLNFKNATDDWKFSLFCNILIFRKMIGPDDIIYKNRYIWNRYKNDLNQRKHHLGFETASLVFDDPFHTEEFDEENSFAEERFNITGSITGLVNNTLVTVSVVYRGDLIRIFSARDAGPLEVRDYYEQFQDYLSGQDED